MLSKIIGYNFDHTYPQVQQISNVVLNALKQQPVWGFNFYQSFPFSSSNKSTKLSWFGHTNFQYINRKQLETSLKAATSPLEIAGKMSEKVSYILSIHLHVHNVMVNW